MKKIRVSVTNDNKISLIFALATDGSDYYLIDCYQSLLANIFFPIYWLVPISVIKLSAGEFENLSYREERSSQKTRYSFKHLLATIVGLSIGRFLYSFLKQLNMFAKYPIVFIFLAIIAVIIVRTVYHLGIRNYLALDGKESNKIHFIPKKIVWSHFLSYTIFTLIVLGCGWLYMSFKDGVTWLIVVFSVFIYSLQSKLAFLPGDYCVFTKRS